MIRRSLPLSAKQTPFTVALGSNVGDRERHVQRALARIDRSPGTKVLATSRLYESAGWGRDNLSPFYNAVISGETTENDPLTFLHLLQKIEDDLGRQRTMKWGPRTLDLDLLYFGDVRVESEALTLPHPYIQERPFVYLPLNEIRSEHLSPSSEGIKIEADSKPLRQQPNGWGINHINSHSELQLVGLDQPQMTAFATLLGYTLQSGDTIAFQGGMGAGKTFLTRHLAAALQSADLVQSPTFTLCKVHDLPQGMILEHWDLYRLHSVDDLESCGFFDYQPEKTIRIVEWSERFPKLFQKDSIHLALSVEDENHRALTLRFPSGRIPLPLTAFLSGQKESSR